MVFAIENVSHLSLTSPCSHPPIHQTLRGFTAYVTNDEHVLLFLSVLTQGRKHSVNGVPHYDPASGMWHMHLSVLYIALGARRKTLQLFLLNAPPVSAFITPRAQALPP